MPTQPEKKGLHMNSLLLESPKPPLHSSLLCMYKAFTFAFIVNKGPVSNVSPYQISQTLLQNGNITQLECSYLVILPGYVLAAPGGRRSNFCLLATRKTYFFAWSLMVGHPRFRGWDPCYSSKSTSLILYSKLQIWWCCMARLHATEFKGQNFIVEFQDEFLYK